ncbi:MAG: hypothetical protein OQK32_05570, partial [Gammaproteobacteria bacterium]|nr:hypothetical protein [Gammaproteobacteria bacterium]
KVGKSNDAEYSRMLGIFKDSITVNIDTGKNPYFIDFYGIHDANDHKIYTKLNRLSDAVEAAIMRIEKKYTQ